MLEVLVRFICAVLMIISGVYTISRITGNNLKKTNIKTYLLLLLLSIFTVLNYENQYNLLFSISIFLLNIVIYKVILQLTIEESIISVSIFMIILFFSDVIISSIFRMFISVEKMRGDKLIFLLSNILVSMVSIILMKNIRIRSHVQRFYSNI